MKPRDLKPLFQRKEPKVVYQDQFLALPTRAVSSFKLPAWEEVFGNSNPVTIEYCSGNGHWIAQMANAYPDRNFVAVEWQFERARRIYSKCKNMGLKNLLVVCSEAQRFTREHVHDKSVSEVFVHFPDPWPKRRHAKHRLVRTPFLNDLSSILKIKGEVTLVTDDRPYLDGAIKDLSAHSNFRAAIEAPYFSEIADYGDSTFAKLWKKLGRTFLLTRFIRLEERPQIFMDGGTVRRVELDCSSRSNLKWEIQPGKPALWELQTDLFDHLHDEMAIRSFEIALDHLVDTVLPHHATFGVLLYKGRGRAPVEVLRSLAARLPDEITPYVALDLSDYEGGAFFHALQRDKLQHFGLILKGGSHPYALKSLGWNQPSSYGVYEGGELLPRKDLNVALCHGEGAAFTLPDEPCRVIPESLLIEEWHGIDHLYVAGVSRMGMRAVAGFQATGGEVSIMTPNEPALQKPQETSQTSSLVSSL